MSNNSGGGGRWITTATTTPYNPYPNINSPITGIGTLWPGLMQRFSGAATNQETKYNREFDEELFKKILSLTEMLTNDPDVPTEKLSEII